MFRLVALLILSWMMCIQDLLEAIGNMSMIDVHYKFYTSMVFCNLISNINPIYT